MPSANRHPGVGAEGVRPVGGVPRRLASRSTGGPVRRGPGLSAGSRGAWRREAPADRCAPLADRAR